MKTSLHALGVPPSQVRDFQKLVNVSLKVGLTEIQAVSIARIAHAAKSGFHWNILPLATGLEINTKLKR